MEAIWNANPTVNMLYCFEDGNCFIKHSEAASYAKTTGAAYTVKMRNEEAKEAANEELTNEEVKEIKPTKTNKK
jgi:hypothetical protein